MLVTRLRQPTTAPPQPLPPSSNHSSMRPRGLSGSESACPCRRQGFSPWSGKIPCAVGWPRPCKNDWGHAPQSPPHERPCNGGDTHRGGSVGLLPQRGEATRPRSPRTAKNKINYKHPHSSASEVPTSSSQLAIPVGPPWLPCGQTAPSLRLGVLKAVLHVEEFCLLYYIVKFKPSFTIG